MSELHRYYEDELRYIRHLAHDFAKQFPATAQRLMLEADRSTDPHVERLIESFAFLTGRIQHKLDDEFPELTDAMLGVLYPHYLAPIPSMAVIQFELDATRADLPDGFRIERHSRLHTHPVEYQQGKRLPCLFRTAYPVTLWPVAPSSARLMPPPFPGGLKPPPKTAAALSIELECQGELTFADLSLDRLRFYLSGDNQLVPLLYELLFNHVIEVMIRPVDRMAPPSTVVMKPEECIVPVGYERDEGMLPYANHSFLGYRLLTEFFTFPNKFLFFDLAGLKRLRRAEFGRKVEVLLFLNRSDAKLEAALDARMLRTGCTPIVNLFQKAAEGINLTQSRFEYRVEPDVAHPLGMEIYSVDSLINIDPVTGLTKEYYPFYSFRHDSNRATKRAFWYSSRHPSAIEGDRGTDVYLNLVDLDFEPTLPAESVLVPHLTCTNRNLAAQLQHAGEQLFFELEAAAPLSRVRCLRTPTAPLRPPTRRSAHWRLISHLNLNHLSLADSTEGRDALQEILRLYDFSDPEATQQLAAVTRNLIDGIVSVSGRRVVGRTGGPTSSGFARGLEVTVEFDERKYVGTGMFLFACVLERFLGLYVSINSFTQFVGKSKQGEGYFKRWLPRAGEHQLL